jgi:hypothetical protein
MTTIYDLLNNLFYEFKQKEYIKLTTKRCELDGRNTYCCMGTVFKLPEKLTMKFTLTNDHIERDENTRYKPYKLNLNFNLN